MYSHLLVRYLEHKYQSLERAEEKYKTLMRLLAQFDTIKANETVMFAELEAGHIPHVYAEIYNVV